MKINKMFQRTVLRGAFFCCLLAGKAIAGPLFIAQTTACATAGTGTPPTYTFSLPITYASGNDRFCLFQLTYNGTSSTGAGCGGKLCGVPADPTFNSIAVCAWLQSANNVRCNERIGAGCTATGYSTATCLRSTVYMMDDDDLPAAAGTYTFSVTLGTCYTYPTEICITMMEWVDVKQDWPAISEPGSCMANSGTNNGTTDPATFSGNVMDSSASGVGVPVKVIDFTVAHSSFTGVGVNQTRGGTGTAATGGFYIGTSYKDTTTSTTVDILVPMSEDLSAAPANPWIMGTVFLTDGSITTPIELLLFAANKKQNNVFLDWSTASERNNDYFTIERSVDGRRFENIGTAKGSGTSLTLKQYNFTDYKPLPGISYYRLKQTDFDGKSSYSRIISITTLTDKIELHAYPNPNRGEALNIRLGGIGNGDKAEIVIYNAIGARVHSFTASDNGSYTLPSDFNLPQGLYFIRAESETAGVAAMVRYLVQ